MPLKTLSSKLKEQIKQRPWLHEQLRKYPRLHYNTFWANFGPASLFLARSIPTKTPPIFVVSLPRSGSSWVGDTLGWAENSIYLREPITQSFESHRRIHGQKGPVYFEINHTNLPPTYKWSLDSAFTGLPIFSGGIAPYYNQWSIGKRRNSRIVIKEVNPLALDWILRSYKPKIIYLLRHPAAVTNSFITFDWTNDNFNNVFSKQTLDKLTPHNLALFNYSFWAQHGAIQAITLNKTLELLKNYPDHLVIKYEDLCMNPLEIFKKIYKDCGLNFDNNIETKILERTNKKKDYKVGDPDLGRKSSDMIDKWKTLVSDEDIEQIKDAYLSFSPSYYGAEEW